MDNNHKARIIAFYLPQYHPIPENDDWWGKGFTEWTNVGRAKPLFRGHYQPKVPADLGYYDLRMPEVREAQAELAREAGVEGFCYWHYWFGDGKQLLERPFKEVVESGKPDFPFCLGWANHSWSNKSWKKSDSRFTEDKILIEQTYPGEKDNENHFYAYLNAFKDKRYLTVDGKLIFVIFDPFDIPDFISFKNQWNTLAKDNGLEGFHFVGITHNLTGFKKEDGKKKYYLVSPKESSETRFKQVLDMGYDAINSRGIFRAEICAKSRFRKIFNYAVNRVFQGLIIDKYKYRDIIKHYFVNEDEWENVYPSIIPNWDRSPRSGKMAKIWYGSTPKLFGEHLKMALDRIKNKNQQHKIIFLKSWNEWAEGNYIEPDILYGKKYLETLKEHIKL
jgi:hypothetical protein